MATTDPADPTEGLHRSGAVARMVGMPVGTLQVWERRYAVCRPTLSPGGHRLYSASQVRRLALIKRLVDRGHAIGVLAGLPMQALQSVAATHVAPGGNGGAAGVDSPVREAEVAAERTAVVLVDDDALVRRLARPAVADALPRPLTVLREPGGHGAPVGLWLQSSPDLDARALAASRERLQAQPQLQRAARVVLHRFSTEASAARWMDAGFMLLREPIGDRPLGQWLATAWRQAAVVALPAAGPQGGSDLPPPRRWTDEQLRQLAGLPSAVACECPQHVAELLMQLAHFESYSEGCAHRSPDDAALHRRLHLVAARARASFESALEHVALYEGLSLPPAAAERG